MLIAIYPLVFVVIGLLIYAFAGPNMKPIGLWVFVTSWLVLMLVMAKQTFHIG